MWKEVSLECLISNSSNFGDVFIGLNLFWYIEDIQFLLLNMVFISSSEVENIYIL